MSSVKRSRLLMTLTSPCTYHPSVYLLKKPQSLDKLEENGGLNVAFQRCHHPAIRSYAEKIKRKRGFTFCLPSSPFSCVSSGNKAALILSVSAKRSLSSFPVTDSATFSVKKIKLRADLTGAFKVQMC